MSGLLIQDFLQTQGLKLPPDEVSAAYAAAQAVIGMGDASVGRSLLWLQREGFKLSDHIDRNDGNEAVLKQVFMALDSVFSRQPDVRSAAVYLHMPSETPPSGLVLLTQQGLDLEPHLEVGDSSCRTHLAARTAQSGWMNVAADVRRWLELGEISGARNEAAAAQVSIPVCTPSGAVLGVLHIEFKEKNQIDDTVLAEWAGLSLALSQPLETLSPLTRNLEKQND